MQSAGAGMGLYCLYDLQKMLRRAGGWCGWAEHPPKRWAFRLVRGLPRHVLVTLNGCPWSLQSLPPSTRGMQVATAPARLPVAGLNSCATRAPGLGGGKDGGREGGGVGQDCAVTGCSNPSHTIP